MLYNQPLDQANNPNAPYIDGNPSAGIQGSIVPAASLECDQREIVEVITRANVRGYKDYSGAPCAVPANNDLTQLRKAIEGFIGDINAYIIDTEVTYTVHGTGATFTDLVAAFHWLGRYKITPTGHVILKLAGSTSGNAQKYTYNQTIVANHPNNDRISVIGAPMLKALPLDDTGYASNGYSSAQRAQDLVTNLAILRSCFATELFFQNLQPMNSGNAYTCGLYIDGTMLMHLDGILFTSDGSNAQAMGLATTCTGYCNGTLIAGSPTISGIAFAQWGWGIWLDAGSSIAMQGAGMSANLWSPVVTLGCINSGITAANMSFFTTYGNTVSLGNGNHGVVAYAGCGFQFDGGVFCCSNYYYGIFFDMGTELWVNGPYISGTRYGPSHLYKNGRYGISVSHGSTAIYADCGAGANANALGSAYAEWGGIIQATDINISGHCSPAWNVVGNGNALIG